MATLPDLTVYVNTRLADDRARLLEACDLVLAADGTMHLRGAVENLRQVVASVRIEK